MAQKKIPAVLRWLGKAALALIFILMAVIFYLAGVMGQPQEKQWEDVRMDQPLTAPAQTRNITSVVQLNELMASFPVEVLCAPVSSGYVLESGSAYDVDFEGGVARIIRLQYATPDGCVLALDSIYPARALDTLKYGDYHLMPVEGTPVAGLRTARMENGETVRLHGQSPTGLYVVTAPMSAADRLSVLVQPLQLMQTE